jgi:hypothetical protein
MENEENKEVPKPPVDDMVPLKPPTVPLFNIPDAVLNSMGKEVAPDLAQIQNPVEWIMKQRKMAETQVSGPKENGPLIAPVIQSSAIPAASKKREKIPVVSWAGQDVSEDTLVMLFYMVVKEASKDKAFKKKLKDMKLEIYDSNQTLLWP